MNTTGYTAGYARIHSQRSIRDTPPPYKGGGIPRPENETPNKHQNTPCVNVNNREVRTLQRNQPRIPGTMAHHTTHHPPTRQPHLPNRATRLPNHRHLRRPHPTRITRRRMVRRRKPPSKLHTMQRRTRQNSRTGQTPTNPRQPQRQHQRNNNRSLTPMVNTQKPSMNVAYNMYANLHKLV